MNGIERRHQWHLDDTAQHVIARKNDANESSRQQREHNKAKVHR